MILYEKRLTIHPVEGETSQTFFGIFVFFFQHFSHPEKHQPWLANDEADEQKL